MTPPAQLLNELRRDVHTLMLTVRVSVGMVAVRRGNESGKKEEKKYNHRGNRAFNTAMS